MDTVLRYALISRDWPLWFRYAMTLLWVGVAYYVHLMIFGSNIAYPFLLFYPVIIAATLFLDRGNGIFASVLSALLAIYYLLPIGPVTGKENAKEVVAIMLFLITGLAMAVFVEALHNIFISLRGANKQISSLAQARGVLLRELAHRTRNDMAALSSLFQLQARSLKEPAAKKAF